MSHYHIRQLADELEREPFSFLFTVAEACQGNVAFHDGDFGIVVVKYGLAASLGL